MEQRISRAKQSIKDFRACRFRDGDREQRASD